MTRIKIVDRRAEAHVMTGIKDGLQTRAVTRIDLFGKLEDQSLVRQAQPPRGVERRLQTCERRIDGVGKEIDRQPRACVEQPRRHHALDRGHPTLLVEVVAILGHDPRQDVARALALAATQSAS